MKILFIGTVLFSVKALEKIFDLKESVVGVVTQKSSLFHSDFSDLGEISMRRGVPVYYAKNINDNLCINWCMEKKPDVVFCFGWSQLLKKDLLNLAPRGVIGFHPALLPQNRGRHPIVWALVLGLKKTGSTFFFMDEGADSGDILSQKEIQIDYEDNAQSLYTKITDSALHQIEEFVPQLKREQFVRIKQDLRLSNTWRKRSEIDGKIDWRLSSRSIYNLVRGLTRPYVGAHMVLESREIKVWRVRESLDHIPEHFEPGKVLSVDNTNRRFMIKCGNGAVEVIEHELKQLPKVGDYL